MYDFDVIIVGSGLVGASFAVALRHSGLRVALLDARIPSSSQALSVADLGSRVYAVNGRSVRFLQRCGVWEELGSDHVQSVHEMQIFGDRDSYLRFTAYASGLAQLAFIVESRALEQAFAKQVDSQDNLTCLYGVKCLQLINKPDAVELELADGRKLMARVLVGADGIESWVRKNAQIAVVTKPYQQRGVVANFEAEKPHRGVAYQWFHNDNVLAMLPLPGKNVSIVWSVMPGRAESMLNMSAEAFNREVELASNNKLGSLRLLNKPTEFPLQLQHLKSLIAPRVALIGDAAHSVHPLAGQGVNLGFADAFKLSTLLMERAAWHDCGDWYLLRRYERSRKEEITMMQMVTDGLYRLFNNQSLVLTQLRNAGLNFTNRITPLKNILVKHAIG